MKRLMRNGKCIRRGVSLLLMVSLLITLLPVVSVAATSTVGAYGSVTVNTKNVVIRSTPAGSRTGFFAQVGTYPMIGPVVEVDGVNWYNLQTNETAGYVSGTYATASFGSTGMPDTDKIYVNIQADVLAYLGDATTTYDHTDTTKQVTILASGDPNLSGIPILQLEDGEPYTVNDVEYINLYYNNVLYHTLYTNNIANGVMSTDNLNTYITEITWKSKSASSYSRVAGAKGDYLTQALQAALSVLDYYDGDIDGSYGAKTESAVKAFRVENNLPTLTDGNADGSVFKELFATATVMLEYIRSTSGLNGSTGGTTTTPTMIKTTVKNLRIRKSYTTSSAYVGIIPTAGTILTFTRTHVSGTTTWYYVQFNGTYGWIMGTYAELYTTSTGTGGTTTTPTITNWGTATITKKLVAIRETANGKRTGYSVNTGDVVTLIGPVVTTGGYDWYKIRTENGREGYVRGDCATAEFGSAGMPDSARSYVNILGNTDIFTGEAVAGNAQVNKITVAASSTVPVVLQLETGVDYTYDGTAYMNLYYNNQLCHTVYTNAILNGMMSSDNINAYITNYAFGSKLDYTKTVGPAATAINTGDIRVQAVQVALNLLGYYKDKLDGMYGDKTGDAIKQYKEDNNYASPDKVVTASDTTKLFSAAVAKLQAMRTAASGSDTSDGTVLNAGDFGTYSYVKKGSWSEIDGGATSLFPKGTVAYVMSVKTKQVFRLYRWSGANHADCVPYDTSDTATLSSIVSFAYNSNSPSATQLAKIKSYGNDDYPLYTWPDFRGGFGGTAISGSNEKIPVWINLNGTVYCASIYVIPHGYTGTSSFSLSKLNGDYFYTRNNFYGMLCVHFYGSTTHASGTVNATHMSNINYAYNQAASYFGSSKVK